jgi:hypothetical protein
LPVPRAVKVAVLAGLPVSPSILVPQCGQKGSAGSTDLPQLAHAFVMAPLCGGADDTRVSGMPFGAWTGSELDARSA